MTEPNTTAPVPLRFQAICRDCGTTGRTEVLFGSARERNRWAGKHVAETGHVVITPAIESDHVLAQVDAAIAATRSRQERYQLLLARTTALSENLRAQAPARWMLTVAVVTAALMVSAEVWQAIAVTWAWWPHLPYVVYQLLVDAAPLLVLCMLLLSRNPQVVRALIAGGAVWVLIWAVELVWPAPQWVVSAFAVVNIAAILVYLLAAHRKLRRVRLELRLIHMGLAEVGEAGVAQRGAA